MAIILASTSPRRQELFRLITPNFIVDTEEIDERSFACASPAALAQQLAAAKAAAVFARRKQDVVIGCDTVVELDGKALGKPTNKAEAIEMLSALSGRIHLVHTGFCVCRPSVGASLQKTETTEVEFANIPHEDILAYAATNEPYDKAGGYGIQGTAARYIPRINGCYYNVMGLPVAAIYACLSSLKIL